MFTTTLLLWPKGLFRAADVIAVILDECYRGVEKY